MTMSDSGGSICSRLLAAFQDEDDDSVSSASLGDEIVRIAVDGLLELSSNPINSYGQDQDQQQDEEQEEKDEEADADDEASDFHCGLQGRTWNWKRSLYNCHDPPPSPENKHISKLEEELDTLRRRKAVLQQGLERVRNYQDELKSFNEKLKQKSGK